MKKTNINIWLENELNAFKPPDRLTVSETACRYRELGKNSAITGLYSLNVVPFFGPIMDAGSDPDIDEITVCKPAQIGGTVALVENICFYYTYQEPASIMVSFADEETATYVAKEKLGNMYKDSTAAYHLYDPKKFTNTTITLLNGARIDLAWASSVAKLATKPARIVIADETDKPGYYTKSVEASALSLLSERFRSFPMGFYKFIKLSTPTTDKGNIITSLESSDIIYDWQVPCPHCGQYQILRWSHDYCYGFQDGFFRDINGDQKKIGRVVWDGGRNANRQQIRETCFYECGECGGKWTTEEKNKAVQRGQMVPRTEPIGDERRIGYHINRLYSLFDSGRLDKLLSDWVAIFKLPKERQVGALQGFVNSTLAEPWKMVVKINTESEDIVLKACVDIKPQFIPEEAIALTCGIDVQKYGFWFVVRAWAKDFTSWNIHTGFLSTWDDVEEILFNTIYYVPSNERGMRIWRAAVDTGGGEKYENMSMVEETYHWLRKNRFGRGCTVWGIKGASRQWPGPEICKIGKPLDKTPSGNPIPGGLRITQLDTHKLKNIFHARLHAAIERDQYNRPAYLHSGIGIEYAKQILAEELIIDDRGNEVWTQKRPDNHLLDAECYALAIAEPEWEGGGVNLIRKRKELIQGQKKETRHKPNNYFGNLGKDFF